MSGGGPAVMANATFNPYSQSFVLLGPDGVNSVPGFLSDVLVLQNNMVQTGIVYGTQIGLSVMLFIIMLVVTRSDKRKSLVFLLNLAAIVLVALRSILSACNLSGVFYNYYNWELHYYPPGPALTHAQALSIAAELVSVLVDAVIVSSLALQVHIVCCNLTPAQKGVVVALSALVGLGATAFRLTLAIVNIKYLVLGINTATVGEEELVNRVGVAATIVSVASIAFFSAVFIGKLANALWTRHKLGMKQFGPMQIVFVMGCQTMFVPLIFAIAAYYAVTGVQLQGFVPAVIAIFLPLSGLWASANTKERQISTPGPHAHARRAIHLGAADSNSGKSYGVLGQSPAKASRVSSDNTADTLVELSAEKYSPGLSEGEDVEEAANADLEMQRLKLGVVVDRTYGVRSK